MGEATMILTDVESLGICQHTSLEAGGRSHTDLDIRYKDRIETYEGHITYRNATAGMKNDMCRESQSKNRIYYAVDEVRQFPKRIELDLQHGVTIIFNSAKLIKTEIHDES